MITSESLKHIRLIATDVDGTLVRPGSPILDPAYFQVLEQLKSEGYVIAVCSGRSEDSIRTLLGDSASGLYLVSNNGAHVSRDGEVLVDEFIKRDVAHRIAADLTGIPHCTPLYATNFKTYYPENTEKYCMDFCLNYGFTMTPVAEMPADLPINKVCVLYSGEGIHPAVLADKKYEGVQRLDAGDGWADFVPDCISKGKAISRIQQAHGIQPSETISFGDQENDISMFKVSGISAAVAGASEVAVAAATERIPSYQDLGVLQVLRQIEVSR